ncbi:unnamed protein product [Phytomonas sp. EM1]|nr:unnamed protein product [Phytomonas sp. EM1]|eukprot:CCW65268.1 unnamed protein product [Phytomonas sp. isolate EM1]
MNNFETNLLPYYTWHKYCTCSKDKKLTSTAKSNKRRWAVGASSRKIGQKHVESNDEIATTTEATEKSECVVYPSKVYSIDVLEKQLLERKRNARQNRYSLGGNALISAFSKIGNTHDTLKDATREKILDELRLCKVHQEERRRDELLRGLQYRMGRGVQESWHCADRTQNHEKARCKYKDTRLNTSADTESNTESDRYCCVEEDEQVSRFSDPMSFLPSTGEGYAAVAMRRQNTCRLMEGDLWLAAGTREHCARVSALKSENIRMINKIPKDELSERIDVCYGSLGRSVKEANEHQDGMELCKQAVMVCGRVLDSGEDIKQKKLALRHNLMRSKK